MMNKEIEQLLQKASRDHLLTLVQELMVQHPGLQEEVRDYLKNLDDEGAVMDGAEESDEEVTEDWDFNGDEPIAFHSYLPPARFPLDALASRQRLEEYAAQLDRETSPQGLMDILSRLIDEAIPSAGQNDANSSLELFALMVDARLHEERPALVAVYDEMIDAAMYTLETLLSEASSNALFDVERVTLAPLLNPVERHRWLERLFALWLKRLDVHRLEENLPEIILDVAWSEDMLLLRSLAQSTLQRQPQSEQGNIVDFTRQYRTKALEKFLKELPRT